MSWKSIRIFVRNFWIWLCRQWAEADEIHRRIEAERLKVQERHGFPGRWM